VISLSKQLPINKFLSYEYNFNTSYSCIFSFSLLQSICKIFDTKDITCMHQIMTTVFHVRMTSQLWRKQNKCWFSARTQV